MLLRHSVWYFLIRGVSGVMGLFTIFLFTRLLTPEQYGEYALALVAVGVISTVFFQWMNTGLGRFMPAYEKSPHIILTTIVAGYVSSLLVTGVLLVLILWLWADRRTEVVVLSSCVVAWGQAWFELTLRIANIRLSPVRYGLLSIARSLLVVAVGASLVYMGYGVPGLLIGTFASTVLVSVVFGWKDWRGADVRCFDADLFLRIFRYGTPLAAIAFLILLVDMSGRVFLGWYSNVGQVGVYAVTSDLVQWSLATLMGVVNLAGFPLIVHTLESKGVRAAEPHLRKYALAMFGVGLPAAVGLYVLARNLAGVLLGEKFHDGAAELIPWLSLAMFLGCTKAFYFDISFQLSGHTGRQAMVAACAATANVALNIWLIPAHGALGAAYSMVAALGGGVVASWYFGTRVFTLPLHRDMYKVVLAAIGMALALCLVRGHVGPLALICQLGLGIVTYFGFVLVLNVEGSRAIATPILSCFGIGRSRKHFDRM